MTLPPIQDSERLIVVVGPSGAGKDSVLREWQRRLGTTSSVHFVQRLITRPVDGRHEAHESCTEGEFARLLLAGELAIAWQANDLHYGVRWRTLAPLAAGEWVVMNGSRAHLEALRRRAPRLHTVEVTAPDHVRVHRLSGRGREDGPAVQQRLHRKVPVDADLTLVNDGELARAVDTLQHWWQALRAR